MFSLIISIVSIALVVALVAATMYYGGDTLTSGREQADASAFVTAGQQIGGAAVMYTALEGSKPADVAALITGGQLASEPVVKADSSGNGWKLDTTTSPGLVKNTVLSAEVCTAINKLAGAPTPEEVTAIGDLAYGCITADKEFQFKF